MYVQAAKGLRRVHDIGSSYNYTFRARPGEDRRHLQHSRTQLQRQLEDRHLTNCHAAGNGRDVAVVGVRVDVRVASEV